MIDRFSRVLYSRGYARSSILQEGVKVTLDRVEKWMKKAMNNGLLWAKKELLEIIEKRNCGNPTSTGN